MARYAGMVFSVDNKDGRACIEYSWVPTGQRHSIVLPGNTDAGSQTDRAPDATDAEQDRSDHPDDEHRDQRDRDELVRVDVAEIDLVGREPDREEEQPDLDRDLGDRAEDAAGRHR